MINLTDRDIIVQRPDGSRFVLKAAAVSPRLCRIEGKIIGELSGVPIHSIDSKYVDFTGVEVDPKVNAPYIVTREIFDALPHTATEYITPDLGDTAVRNAFREVHAVTRFASKVVLPITRPQLVKTTIINKKEPEHV